MMRGKLSASTANCVSASSMIQTPKKHILQDADIGYLIRLVKQVDLCFVENLSFFIPILQYSELFINTVYLFIFFFFQKKVQPDLVVDVKPGGRGRLSKVQEDKFRRQWEQEQYWQWKKYKQFS